MQKTTDLTVVQTMITDISHKESNLAKVIAKKLTVFRGCTEAY